VRQVGHLPRIITIFPVLFSLLVTKSGFQLRSLDSDSCYKRTESLLFCCLWT